MIKPTVGRIVLYHPAEPHDQPQAAIVTSVTDDRNIGVYHFRHNDSGGFADVPLLQNDDDVPPGPYAEWMDYQKQQASDAQADEAEEDGAADPAEDVPPAKPGDITA